MRSFFTIAAISGALAVLLGAFGAHLLKQRLVPDLIEIYKTGVQYQFYHTIALFVVALLGRNNPTKLLKWSGYLFITGMVIFSGMLYLLAITGIRSLGMVVPVGGVALVAAWVCLLLHFWKKQDHH